MLRTPHDNRTKRLERLVFEHFVSAAELQTVADTLHQPPPPEPDILVNIVGRGFVAFELGRLNGKTEAHRNTTMDWAAEEFETEVESRDPASRIAINAFLADARIMVAPRDGHPNRELRSAARWVVDCILRSEPDFDGNLETHFPGIPDVLAYAQVLRYADVFLPGAPRFNMMTGGYAQRANFHTLEEKLLGQYTSAAPIELVAYMDRSHFAFSGETEEATRLIADLGSSSVFQAVWLYEALLGRATRLAIARE